MISMKRITKASLIGFKVLQTTWGRDEKKAKLVEIVSGKVEMRAWEVSGGRWIGLISGFMFEAYLSESRFWGN
jgi:hypothetical protein